MSGRNKSIQNSTQISTMSLYQGTDQLNQVVDNYVEQNENNEITSEGDEDSENSSSSQCRKQTEFSQNKEDAISTSRFDFDFINNALINGFNNSNSSKSLPTDHDAEEFIDPNQQSDFKDVGFQSKQQWNNCFQSSSFNGQIQQNIVNGVQQQNCHQIDISFLKQQQEYMQFIMNDHLNEINLYKDQILILEQENKRLHDENSFLKQQSLTNQDLIRIQAEYVQRKYDEKMIQGLQDQQDKYEGKISNYKEQIQMYQTIIDNIRQEYKEKNQKLSDSIVKLESEKQELMNKNMQLMKDIQNQQNEENSQLKQSQIANNTSYFNQSFQFNQTNNAANDSFDNNNSSNSFSKKVASIKISNQSQNISHEKLQDIQIDSIMIHNRNNQYQSQAQKNEILNQNSTNITQNSYIKQFSQDIQKKQPKRINNPNIASLNSKKSEQSTNSNSSKNPFYFKRLSQQLEKDNDINDSFCREYQIKFKDSEEENQQKYIQSSIIKGKNHNNISFNIRRRSDQLSPNSFKQTHISKNNQDKRSNSIDTHTINQIKKYKSSNLGDHGQQKKYQFDSSFSRVQQYKDQLFKDNDILRKRNNNCSHKFSLSQTVDNSDISNLGCQDSLNNSFIKMQNIAIQSNQLSQRNQSNNQKNSSIFSNTFSSFNKENTQVNLSHNMSSYMNQTQSSIQKKRYKSPDNQTTKHHSKQSYNSKLQDNNEKSLTSQQKKQFNQFINIKKLNNL